jgi:hypothetical protein
MGIKIINRTGSDQAAFIEDLKANYEFKKIDGNRLYITDTLFLWPYNTTYYQISNGSDSKNIITNTGSYCMVVTDTGVAFGNATNTISSFIGKTTSEDGTTSAGVIYGAYNGSYAMTDSSVNVKTFQAPRSTTETSGSLIQLVPTVDICGSDTFDDAYWVLFANKNADDWTDSLILLNNERYYVGNYLAVRYNE